MSLPLILDELNKKTPLNNYYARLAKNKGNDALCHEFLKEMIDFLKKQCTQQFQDTETKALCLAIIKQLWQLQGDSALALLKEWLPNQDYQHVIRNLIESLPRQQITKDFIKFLIEKKYFDWLIIIMQKPGVNWSQTFTSKNFSRKYEYAIMVSIEEETSVDTQEWIMNNEITYSTNLWCPLTHAALEGEAELVAKLVNVKDAVSNAVALLHQLTPLDAQDFGKSKEKYNVLQNTIPENERIKRALTLVLTHAKVNQEDRNILNYNDKRLLVETTKQRVNAITDITDLSKTFIELSRSLLNKRRYFTFISSLPNSMKEITTDIQDKALSLANSQFDQLRDHPIAADKNAWLGLLKICQSWKNDIFSVKYLITDHSRKTLKYLEQLIMSVNKKIDACEQGHKPSYWA